MNWSASECGHRSAAIFKSSMSVVTSCFPAFITIPFVASGRLQITTDVAVSGITKRRISASDGIELLQPDVESALHE